MRGSLRDHRARSQALLSRMSGLDAAPRYLALAALDGLVVLLLPILWLLRQAMPSNVRRRRISVWTGAPIITVARNCRAERSLGFESVSIVRTSYYITDEFDWVMSRMVGDNRALAFLLTYPFFLAVCLVAEQVHAYSDGALLPSRRRRHFSPVELFAYRVLGIRLMIWTYGADIRTREVTMALGEPNCCTECTQVGNACVCDASSAMANFDRTSRAATEVFSMGDMIEYTPGSRNDLFFWPIDLSVEDGARYRPVYPVPDFTRPLRVVHAPNHRQFKGTGHLEQAIAGLRQEGLAIELILVERLPNEQALEIYRSADVVFDQCLIGFHGYFALEAMALGKPVMCFIRKPDEYLLHPEECPIIRIHVDTLEKDLRRLVEHRDDLPEIGQRGRSYIEKHFSMEAFAGRLQNAYRDLGIPI